MIYAARQRDYKCSFTFTSCCISSENYIQETKTMFINIRVIRMIFSDHMLTSLLCVSEENAPNKLRKFAFPSVISIWNTSNISLLSRFYAIYLRRCFNIIRWTTSRLQLAIEMRKFFSVIEQLLSPDYSMIQCLLQLH